MTIEQTLAALGAALGPGGLLVGDDIGDRHRGDIHGNLGETPIAVARPRDTAQVSQVLAACNAAGIPVVTHGGRSGLVLSCTTRAGELVLSTERMTAIESIDADACTATVQAGVVLQTLQERLEPDGLSFPLDLGGRGSCTIGGNIATNAGGNRVIRYGMTRDLVLGLEAVLADGTVLDGLKPFIKNNTGVDLKQLFIGSEGVLGVVTRAVLRLVPKPEDTAVAFCGLAGFDRVRAMLRHLRRSLGGDLTAFEVLWKGYYTRYLGLHPTGAPMPDAHRFYVLTESSGSGGDGLQERFERALADAIDEGIVDDAVIAKSGSEAAALWHMRDLAIEVARTLGPHSAFDVSLRIAEMEAFAGDLDAVAHGLNPGCETLVFGHAGDGNLHLAVSRPPGSGLAKGALEAAVYDLVRRYGGSVSAEHGIGVSRLEYLGHTRTAAEIEAMRALKRTLDPNCILNPGRVLSQVAAPAGT
ncbi:FAD-binding oxidoreductase [Quisquiliibacterium transsilvanicum]|uniref:FAD/FMN-containing dehydrogenase n=1 Tax=Quisquiliibacterium transsilvanicum TaxID=1549638 RepID=A0A7W8MA20_9BURK|nr:FAD-binding oxidoreductase [Quisquiliibacterium transsilvanicum]MBB5272935.1 FAD/FMN-containing dehydrogenase [Quisquiliibacterium transsilvanicum]